MLKPHDHLCLFHVLDGLKDFMLVGILLYILDIKVECLTMLYRSLQCASQSTKFVDVLKDKILDDVDDYVFPSLVISTAIWGSDDEALVYDWYGAIDNTLCFDFGLLTLVMNIEMQLSDDVPIESLMLGEFTIRNSFDLKDI